MKEGFPLHPLRRKLLVPVRRPEGAAGRRVFPQLHIAARPALRGADSEKSGFLWREREHRKRAQPVAASANLPFSRKPLSLFPQLRIAARPALRGADSEKSGFLWREREGTFLSPERKVPSQNPVPSLLLVRVLFVFLVAQVDQAFRVRFG